jgi:hypothetical protein
VKIDQNRKNEKEIRMKTMLVALLSLMVASTAFADDSVVRWNRIAGVITSLNVDNPVNDIHSGTFAWTTTRGRAEVNLTKGEVKFQVQGLVINGSQFSGTAGPITAVVGTLVCNAGETDSNGNSTEKVLDTAQVPLSLGGDAQFSGDIGSIDTPCDNPLFLVRIAQPEGAFGLWIATGSVRSSDHKSEE